MTNTRRQDKEETRDVIKGINDEEKTKQKNKRNENMKTKQEFLTFKKKRCRMGPYFIGVLLGYAIYVHKQSASKESQVNN